MRTATTGQRRQRVQILAPAATLDSYNANPSTDFVLLDTYWARVLTTRGSEEFRAQQLAPEATHLVDVLNDSLTRTLTPQHAMCWVRDEGNVFLDIKWIDPREQRTDGLLFACLERAGVMPNIVDAPAVTPPTPPSVRAWQLYSAANGNLTGAIDGVNKTFTLPAGVIPNPATAQVLFNGVKLAYGIGDYSFSGNQVILSDAPNPASGDTPADMVEVYA